MAILQLTSDFHCSELDFSIKRYYEGNVYSLKSNMLTLNERNFVRFRE